MITHYVWFCKYLTYLKFDAKYSWPRSQPQYLTKMNKIVTRSADTFVVIAAFVTAVGLKFRDIFLSLYFMIKIILSEILFPLRALFRGYNYKFTSPELAFKSYATGLASLVILILFLVSTKYRDKITIYPMFVCLGLYISFWLEDRKQKQSVSTIKWI